MTKDEADLLTRVLDTLSQRVGDVAPGAHTDFYAEYNEAFGICGRYATAEIKPIPLILSPGLYHIKWKDGGESEAAVGVTADGGRWLAPTNWIAPGDLAKHINNIADAQRLNRLPAHVTGEDDGT